MEPHTTSRSTPDVSSDRSDLTRTGAIWVTATGAFLLVVAAAIFVAVRWDTLPDSLKLSLLVAATGAALIAGRSLRETLPAAGSVLFHLGAFLLPIDAAALALRFDVGWPGLLLVEGLAGSVAFTALERIEHSIVLRWAAGGAVIVAAAGIGATTALPAGLALAICAGVAALRGAPRAALAWGLMAGLSPAAALVAPVVATPGSLVEMGLAGPGVGPSAALTGMLAATVIAVQARRRGEAALLVPAALAVAIGALAAFADLRPAGLTLVVAAALAFLAVELTALLLRDDDFWSGPAATLAIGTEALVLPASCGLGLLALVLVPLAEVVDPGGVIPAVLLAGLLGTAGWLLADQRRRVGAGLSVDLTLLIGASWTPATYAVVATIAAGIGFGTTSPPALAAALLVGAGWLVLSGRPHGHGLATLAAWCAPAVVAIHPVEALAAGLGGALAVGAAAVVRAGRATRRGPGVLDLEAGWLLTFASVVPIAIGTSAALSAGAHVALVLASAMTSLWAVGLVIEHGESHPGMDHLGLVPRAAALLPLAMVGTVDVAALALLSGLATVLVATDAVRRRDPAVAVLLAISVPYTAAATMLSLGLGGGGAGVAVTSTGVVAVACWMVFSDRWAPPTLAIAITAAMVGPTLAVAENAALAACLILVGGAMAAIALHIGDIALGAIGAIVTTAGVWGELATAGVKATDAYAAPVAAALVVAGVLARRRGVGSWVAFGPAIVLLGSSSVADRVTGGIGLHALVAGAVGTAAVLAGGRWRLVAPLLLGTGLLVVVAGIESVGYTAGVPTWAWLGLAGTILVGGGILMERAATGPIETGRRVVDSLRDGFT